MFRWAEHNLITRENCPEDITFGNAIIPCRGGEREREREREKGGGGGKGKGGGRYISFVVGDRSMSGGRVGFCWQKWR